MIGGMGSSENTIQSTTASSSINDLTIFFGGNDNERTNEDQYSQAVSPTQVKKDELGITASVGVGVGGGSGSGGTVATSDSGDEFGFLNTPKNAPSIGGFKLDTKGLLIIGGVILSAVGGFFLWKKLKKKG